VAAVDHDARRGPRFLHLDDGIGNTINGVVHHLAAAAQDDVALRISIGDEDGGLPMLGVAQKSVRVSGGEDGVDGNLHVARGSVLKPTGQERPETSWRCT